MRYDPVRQHDEEDCGAACVATVAKHYGRTLAISRIREAVGTGSQGTSLLGLSRGAEFLGFNTRQVKANPDFLDQLHQAPLPAPFFIGRVTTGLFCMDKRDGSM